MQVRQKMSCQTPSKPEINGTAPHPTLKCKEWVGSFSLEAGGPFSGAQTEAERSTLQAKPIHGVEDF